MAHPLVKSLLEFKPLEYKRMSWDDYFASIALVVSFRSPTDRLQVGAVIVKDNRVLSTGYNGYAPGAPHVSIIVGESDIAAIHAEQNAIAVAAKNGIAINEATIYVTHHPCINCAKMIVASGIKQVVYLSDYKENSKNESIVQLLQAGGVTVRKYGNQVPE